MTLVWIEVKTNYKPIYGLRKQLGCMYIYTQALIQRLYAYALLLHSDVYNM